jgi:predicted dinucleotide-binding enzyme
VVSAFKTLPAGMLGELARPLAGDVLLCGEDQTARAEVGALIARLPGLRAVEAGGIISARGLEALAALLINVNRRYRTETTVRILGVP